MTMEEIGAEIARGRKERPARGANAKNIDWYDINISYQHISGKIILNQFLVCEYLQILYCK